MADVNNVVANENEVVVEPVVPAAPETGYKFGKTASNIAIGVGIGVTGAFALYGLYELGKKGFGLIKKQIEKRKMEHPVYEYEKVETADEAEKADEIKASLKRHKKEKHPMGFQYKA